MAKKNTEIIDVTTPNTPVVKAFETEQEMIDRIMKGNGSSDEYVDKYHKDFPVPWR